MATNVPVTADTPIAIKISINDTNAKKLKLPLRDLTSDVLPTKVCQSPVARGLALSQPCLTSPQRYKYVS